MKALITAPFHPDAIRMLESHMAVVYESWKDTATIYMEASVLARRVRDVGADVLIVEADMVYAETFDAVALRIVGSARANPYNIDVDAATRNGVPVFYTPGRNAEAVADFTVGLIIALLRKIHHADRLLRTGSLVIQSEKELTDLYTRFTGRELASQTIGLVGLGAIGGGVARRLGRGFGARLLVYDPYVDSSRAESLGAEQVSLERLLAESDVISIHAAVTEETQGLVDEKKLCLIRPSAYLVNTARSFILDEDALYELLSQKKIAGAALDVFDREPVDSSNRFLKLDNVLVTPHIGGATEDVVRHQSMSLASDIEAYLQGRAPRHIRNPEVLSKGTSK